MLESILNIRFVTKDLQQLVGRIKGGIHSMFQKQVMLASVAALVYSIWQGRNEAYWQQTVPRISKVVQQIKSLIKARIHSVMPKKMTRTDVQWFEQL